METESLYARADDSAAYPIIILDADGALIDRTSNVESAESVLYGDLASHDGRPRLVTAPAEDVDQLRYLARINADCYGLPLDRVQCEVCGAGRLEFGHFTGTPVFVHADGTREVYRECETCHVDETESDDA